MTAIDTTPPTIKAIYDLYENTQNEHRPHLCASVIGKPCDRALWYSFRWCDTPHPDGQIKRLFQTGHREEVRLIEDLRNIGLEVRCTHPKDPRKQIHFSDPDCPHFSGSVDAIARGFPEAPKAWHIVEIKTSNRKQFDLLKQNGVKRHRPEHFAQMQMYMHWSHIDRAYYFAVCKDNDGIHGERIHYDKESAEALTKRAHSIIYADEPPERSPKMNRDYPPCVWCDYRRVCYGERCAEVNCRTCAHSYIDKEFGWSCNMNHKKMNCEDDHIFIPALVPLECCGADEENGTISYVNTDGTELVNGPGHTSSKELREMINNDTQKNK